MTRPLLLSLPLLLLLPVYSDCGYDVGWWWCGQWFIIDSVLRPGQCPSPPCGTTHSSRTFLSLPAIISFNTTKPHRTVLALLSSAGGVCGGVVVEQFDDGSGKLSGGICGTRGGGKDLRWSDREEGQWLHVGVEVQGRTMTLHPLTPSITKNVTLTNQHCLPSFLQVEVLTGPNYFGYSALTTATTPRTTTTTTTTTTITTSNTPSTTTSTSTTTTTTNNNNPTTTTSSTSSTIATCNTQGMLVGLITLSAVSVVVSAVLLMVVWRQWLEIDALIDKENAKP